MPKRRRKLTTKKQLSRKTIGILDDDCVDHIINFLPICDRIRLERVSKYWSEASRRSWINFEKLNFSKELWGFFEGKWINNDILRQVLTKCGMYLTHLSFNDKDENDCPLVIPDLNFEVFKLTPNLISVVFENTLFTPENLQIFTNYCKLIKEITFNDLLIESDSSICTFFRKTLDEIMTDIIFRAYNKLRVLKFNRCDIGDCLKRAPLRQIEELDFNLFSTLCSNADFTDIICRCRNLKKLRLANIPLDNIISPRVLSLSDNDFLKLIRHCRNINTLKLYDINDLTEIGMDHIADLDNLEHLYLKNLPRITGESFRDMLNLRTLSCLNCANIDMEHMMDALEDLEKLKMLDLTGCLKIYQRFATFAIRNLTETNRLDLTIVIGHLSHYTDDIPKISEPIESDYLYLNLLRY